MRKSSLKIPMPPGAAVPGRFTGFDHVVPPPGDAKSEGFLRGPSSAATLADLAALKAAVEGGLSLKLSRAEAERVADGAINHYFAEQGRAMHDAEEERVKKVLEGWWGKRYPLLLDEIQAKIPPNFGWLLVVHTLLVCLLMGGLIVEHWRMRAATAPKAARAETIQPTREAAAKIDWANVGAPSPEVKDTCTINGEPCDRALRAAAPFFVTVTYRVDRPCWVDADGVGGMVAAGDGGHVVSARPVEIRAGCPGAIHYEVDGREVRPANLSRTPAKSERVVLPQGNAHDIPHDNHHRACADSRQSLEVRTEGWPT